MAVLIAGQGGGTGMAGIAPGARILPVVVNRAGSSGPTMSAGIRFAVDHGAKVINISQGAPGVPPPACDIGVQQAVAYAAEHDVVVVASAGDSGNTDNYPQWPASCAGVLAVGGVEPDGSLWPGSQRESYVDVTGPGDHVGWSGKDGKYIPDSYGTSGAAALVSGAAALIRSRYPSMPARTVVQRLINTTVPLGHPVPNDSTGYGLIDIFRALDVRAYPVAASAPNPPFAALDQWLASPAGRQAGAATGPPSLPPASPVAGPAGASGGGIAPVAIIVAIVALLLVAAVVAGGLCRTARQAGTWRALFRRALQAAAVSRPAAAIPGWRAGCRSRADGPVRPRPTTWLLSRAAAIAAARLWCLSGACPTGAPAAEPWLRPTRAPPHRAPATDGTPARESGIRHARAGPRRTPARYLPRGAPLNGWVHDSRTRRRGRASAGG